MLSYLTVSVIAFLYVILDVNYFLRIAVAIAFGRIFQRKIKLSEKTWTFDICLTQDVDIFVKHMNNARYLRVLDFARFHYYDLSGIYAEIAKRGGGAVQSASSARYRKPISIFSPYKVNTRMIYWEGKNFYLIHEFVGVWDNFVRAVVLSKQTVTGLKVQVSEIIEKVDPSTKRPELTDDLRLWMESMAESSAMYKKETEWENRTHYHE